MAESVNQLTFVPPASPGDAARVEGVRNARYAEVLLVRAEGDRLNAEVWNTLGLNDCPDDAWRALDDATIAAEEGALLAILNGPRYWLMDAIENTAPRPSAGLPASASSTCSAPRSSTSAPTCPTVVPTRSCGCCAPPCSSGRRGATCTS